MELAVAGIDHSTLVNDFDLINTWGGVSCNIDSNIILQSRYDGMDLFTAGESSNIVNNIVRNCSRIGIQTKIDTNSNDRDSLGAGLNRRLNISNNIIESVGPKSSDPSSVSSVTDINGIMVLFSDDQGEIPSPTNGQFIHHANIENNIIIGVSDDEDLAEPDARITGISLDGYNLHASGNIITGVRRQPSSTVTNSGNGISINSVGVGAVNHIYISGGSISAEVNGIYINGSVSKTGRVNNIGINNVQIFRDDTQTGQDISYSGIFITPGCDDIAIRGGQIDSGGPAIRLRRDFNNFTIDGLDSIGGDSDCLLVEGFGNGLTFKNSICNPASGEKKLQLLTSTASHWETESTEWKFEGLVGDGDIDLTFDNTHVGGINGIRAYFNDMQDDSKIIISGFDISGGNLINNVYVKGNTFPNATTTPCIDIFRSSQIFIRGNECDAGANSVNLVRLSNSCDRGVIKGNAGVTGAGALVNIGAATNIAVADNDII